MEKPTRLNEKILDPVGGALQCQLDTSIRNLLDGNLNQLNKIILICELHRWTNKKLEYKNLIM